MIKLTPCPNITKRELMTALMEGCRFHIGDEFKEACIIHWDDNFGDIPVRIGLMHWRFRGFKYLHEITESHWYDNIPECGIPCRVWDDEEDGKHVALITSGHIDSYFNDSCGITYDNAEPLTKTDLYQEPV